MVTYIWNLKVFNWQKKNIVKVVRVWDGGNEILIKIYKLSVIR